MVTRSSAGSALQSNDSASVNVTSRRRTSGQRCGHAAAGTPASDTPSLTASWRTTSRTFAPAGGRSVRRARSGRGPCAPSARGRWRLRCARGYDWLGSLRRFAAIELDVAPGDEVVFTASTEAWAGLRELDAGPAMRLDDERRLRLLAQADPALRRRASAPSWCWPPTSSSSRPHGRAEDEARLRGRRATRPAPSSPATTGSPTGAATPMISLEGLTLATGRPRRGAATSCAPSPTTSATA